MKPRHPKPVINLSLWKYYDEIIASKYKDNDSNRLMWLLYGIMKSGRRMVVSWGDKTQKKAVRKGYVKLSREPGFSRNYTIVQLTPAGRDYVLSRLHKVKKMRKRIRNEIDNWR